MTERVGHDYFRLLAAAGIDGELTSSEASELGGPLGGCAACRADECAMRLDNAWLASAEAAAPVPARVRDAVLRGARGNGLSPGRGLPRLATSLTVLFVAIGALWWLSLNPILGPGDSPSVSVLPSEPTAPPTLAPTEPLAPALWSVPPGTPFARVEEAHLIGNSTGAAPEIVVTAIVIGGNEGAPQGYVSFNDPTGESWLGSITRASYGFAAEEDWYVARIEGCKGGGVAPCDLYALQFIDWRARSDGSDEISLSYVTSQRPEPDPWEFWYLLVSGSILVDGPIPGAPETQSPEPSR